VVEVVGGFVDVVVHDVSSNPLPSVYDDYDDDDCDNNTPSHSLHSSVSEDTCYLRGYDVDDDDQD
jgi:hypothetical protein